MSVCKRVLVLGLVLDWTQCLPQGAGTPPAMLRGCMTGFPPKSGPGPPERQDKVDTICTVPLDCGTPTTRRLYPFGAVAPYRYLLHTVYLFMADIANPDVFVCSCRTWICLDITCFMRSSASHPVCPHGRLSQKR